MKNICEYILDQMKHQTLADIHQKTGINRTRIHRIRSENSEPRMSEVIKIAEGYGVTFEELIWHFSRNEVELLVAKKHDITLDLLKWKLTGPNNNQSQVSQT